MKRPALWPGSVLVSAEPGPSGKAGEKGRSEDVAWEAQPRPGGSSQLFRVCDQWCLKMINRLTQDCLGALQLITLQG